MKRCLIAFIILCFVCSLSAVAQQDAADTPATKEDVERYLQVMHSHEMMDQMATAMLKPMHNMLHERFLKDKDKLPSDFEARMNSSMDEMMKRMPWDEVMESMVPVYQKYLTKKDIDGLVTFYSSPTGQKMLRQMPAMMGDAMEAMMPIMNKEIDRMNHEVQQQVAEMMKESGKTPAQRSPYHGTEASDSARH